MSKTQKRSDKDHRSQIKDETIRVAHSKVLTKLRMRLQEKGAGAWLSRHELLGIIVEEYDELIDAVHGKSLIEVKKELEDLGVSCTFAIACIDSNALDW